MTRRITLTLPEDIIDTLTDLADDFDTTPARLAAIMVRESVVLNEQARAYRQAIKAQWLANVTAEGTA